MQKLLISACLLGHDVTYDRHSNFLDHPLIAVWRKEGRIVPVCPEVAGGLPTPRPAAYIVGIGGGKGVFNNAARVMKQDGGDVTAAFVAGAQKALETAQKNNIKIAILKERSPSCGSHEIYKGDFSGDKISDMGVTAELLVQHGIAVFSENEVEKAAAALKALEAAIQPRPPSLP